MRRKAGAGRPPPEIGQITPARALRAAVALVAGRLVTEASGNMALARIAGVAATGVDYISVGALTHSAPVLDLGLDF